MPKYYGCPCEGCGEPLTLKDDIVVCPDCGAPYHRTCYEKLGRCIHSPAHAAGYEWHFPYQDAELRTCPSCGERTLRSEEICRCCGAALPPETEADEQLNDRKAAQDEQHGGFDYDSDYYGDDLPFWSEVACSDGSQRPHLIVPYTLDANDMRFATAQGFNTAEQFYTYLKDSFDVLYAEGETAPKMMSVGMHCRLLGRPGRFRALQRFLDYIQQHDKVWVCTRQQIADHWRETHPYRG